VVLSDFVQKTGMVMNIFTQLVKIGVSAYLVPQDIVRPETCFVAGAYIDHSTLQDLDDSVYGWRRYIGQPTAWHDDGLPTKTLELVPAPNYTGASYPIPVESSSATTNKVTTLSGTLTLGTAGVAQDIFSLINSAGWDGGSFLVQFQVDTYSPGTIYFGDLNVSLSSYGYSLVPGATTSYGPFQANSTFLSSLYLVGSATGCVLHYEIQELGLAPAPLPGPPPYGVYWQINPADYNLTMVGAQGLTTNVFTDLNALIPVIPDSFCFYLGYGVLAMIFSTDGEAKDTQRAAYCNSRYQEGVNLGTQISGKMQEG
jgi:hypothetical protein